MKFTFSTPDNTTRITLDVADIERELGDGTMETLSSAIMVKVASWAVVWAVRIQDIEPDSLVFGSDEIEIDSCGEWMVEIAQLFHYLENDLSTWQEPGVYLAYLNGNGWRWCDFDNIDDWTDGYQEEYPDDLDDWGQQRLADFGEDLPDHLSAYFDYAKYAEDALENYSEYKWDGTRYLFSE